MKHPIGSPEWFKAIDPKYRHVAVAWMLGACVQFDFARNATNFVDIVMRKDFDVQFIHGTNYHEGTPFELRSHGRYWQYRIAP
jgi:hypothetical protein